MEKSNKIFLIIIIVCAVLVIGLCVFAIATHKEVKITDAEKFKNEYEAYNGIKDESTNKNFQKVTIDKNNPIIYKTSKEILEVLENEKAYIYFGYPYDPNCRNIIETFLSVAKDNNIEKIYYVDISDIRDEYEFDGTLIPKETKKGTDAYYKILDFFGDKLQRYYVPDEKGNMYSTNVKRLEASTIIAVDKGKIKDMHVGTVDNHFDVYKKLTNEEKEELSNIYQDLFNSLNEED